MGIKSKKRVKHKKPTTKEARKRAFVYRPLHGRPSVPDSGFNHEAYEYFKEIKWDDAWKEFISNEEDGRFKHKTSYAFAKHLVGENHSKNKDKEEKAAWLYAAIGPIAPDEKKKHIVPYLGDWSNMRSSLFVGEWNKESLLFGNPKIAAVRELVKKHYDVMEISQGLAGVLMEWMGRYQTWSDQVDAHYNFQLFDPKLNEEDNDKRFMRYTKKQEYLFSRTIDGMKQVLKCFGVGENDVALLTQMMIQSMKSKLGDSTAAMMMAASAGMKMMPGDMGMGLPGSTTQQAQDANTIEGLGVAFAHNTQLKLMLGTFANKAKAFDMEHPDIDLGTPKDDIRTDPSKDPPKMPSRKQAYKQ